MEQILAFAIGVSAALLVWGVVVAFKTANRVETLQRDLESIVNMIDENRRAVYEQTNGLDRRIDQEIDRVDLIYTNILSTLDSRIDKLDAKFCKDGKALTEKSKEFLKG
jgi:hypothetical protein